MIRLYRFNLFQMIREKEEMFWPLVFPLILGTLFYFSFGTGLAERMQPVPAALVEEGNSVFEAFLEAQEGETLLLSEMEEVEALEALKSGAVEGIFYSGTEPSLTVAGTQISESILETLLEAYCQNERMVRDAAGDSLLRLPAVLDTVSDYRGMTEQIRIGAGEANESISYFFALIGMACMFGAFMGMTSAQNLRADRSALAARRSVVPVSRLSMVIGEMLAVFTIQFANICILLAYLKGVLGISFGPRWPMMLPVCMLGSIAGVSIGIFIGSLSLREEVKIGVLVAFSLTMSFLSGLMIGNMKHVIEEHCPILNRINPAALISDAFYSISVYDNPERYWKNLVLLGLIAALLTMAGFWKLRRERYDSI